MFGVQLVIDGFLLSSGGCCWIFLEFSCGCRRVVDRFFLERTEGAILSNGDLPTLMMGSKFKNDNSHNRCES